MFALKNHPFAVEAYFKKSVVLTYAIPKEQLIDLIPECLTLDTYHDKWGFIALAMVQTQNLRPKGFPIILGQNFYLIGYRIFVKYTNNTGKRLRGLFILKSETDKSRMAFLGNIFTHYNYSQTDIHESQNERIVTLNSKFSNLKIEYKEDEQAELPVYSPFINWKEARRFAGPLPFTFSYNKDKKEVLIIKGVRSNWKPEPITIVNHHSDFIKKFGFKTYSLANAFQIKDIPYHWEKGLLEKWKP